MTIKDEARLTPALSGTNQEEVFQYYFNAVCGETTLSKRDHGVGFDSQLSEAGKQPKVAWITSHLATPCFQSRVSPLTQAMACALAID